VNPLDQDEFFRSVWPRLVIALTSFTGDSAIAEELAQEALVRAIERWDRVSSLEAPAMYVYRTGLNLARSRWRRAAVERRVRGRLLERETAPPDPADVLALRAEILALPERQRAAIVLRFHADLSVAVEDTALVMECAPGTVKALTHHAMTRLRGRLIDVDASEEVAIDDR
jgi:RNA polymerase sigma-70 factor (ECF subfamily)